ncbi:transporter substrate-binding domain-containing protein [Roseibium denhamense]|nr:transporter substrate-binding domain-containing protein [Roseibium denhamense]
MPLAFAEPLKLTTLHWPPYVEADGEGPNTDVVRDIFSLAGVQIEVEVFPWNRAIKLAEEDTGWIGVFPEYYSAEIDAEKGGSRCLFSKSFGVSPVGFLKPENGDFNWSDHDDLTQYVIGVVRGYVNETRLDAMIADQKVTAELSENDEQNILKLAFRRMDAIVIDKLVFDYLKSKSVAVARVADSLEFHPKLLVEHGLRICFENSARGRQARDLFDAQIANRPNRRPEPVPEDGMGTPAVSSDG